MDQPVLSVADDDVSNEELFEMANLRGQQTGVPGTIYISTQQGSHGPRVKYYPGRPGPTAPHFVVAVSGDPTVVAVRGLSDGDIAAVSAAVCRWVRLNEVALTRFWFEGSTWFDDEVAAFKGALQRV